MWQYTSSGRVLGISGPVDLSHAYKDYAAIIQRAGLTKVRGA
jgi:GH25 family lysozyme M1 (1,4-beta-N-acetylmuramidase)